MRQVIGDIYRENRQGLFSLALTVTRNSATAEDAVHNAFARLAQRESIPAGDPVAYVFAAVRNAAIDLVRKVGRRQEVPDTVIDYEAATEHDQSGEVAEEIAHALEELPDTQRQVVVMKVYGELTFQQIAETVNEPLSTVSSRYQRALEALRQKLEVPV